MTIRFNLKRTIGRTTTIRAITRENGIKKTYSTRIKIEINDWDRKRERSKTDQRINKKLEEIRKQIETTGQPKPETKPENLIQAIQERKAKTYERTGKENSLKAYNTLIKNIQAFNEQTGTKPEQKPEYAKKLLEWMNKKGYAAGYCGKMIQTLKTVFKSINPALANEISTTSRKHADKIYLTPEEIEQLETVELNGALDKTRDLFLIGYYTGQRYSDWSKIKHENVLFVKNSQIIQFYSQKTGANTAIPVTAKLESILAKYDGSAPKLSNQKANVYLRQVAKKAGICQNVTIKEYRGEKVIESSFEKWQLVTSHTARRSFATNALAAGIPMLDIMKLGGWKSVASFAAYIRTTSVETAVNYSEHEFFK